MIYSPKEDITAFEVAKCLEIFEVHRRCCMNFDSLKRHIDSYSPEIRRHFRLK